MSLIKANLSVPISSEVWDEAVDLLSSLREWQELIEEWAVSLNALCLIKIALKLTDLAELSNLIFSTSTNR